MLFRDEIIDPKGSIRVNRINLGLDIPTNLMPGVGTICKLENLLQSGYLGSGVYQLQGWTGSKP